MSRVIGYLEGTDSLWLTSLQLLGHDTLPLANGDHGQVLDLQQLTPQHHVDVVICYLHKLVPVQGEELRALDMLHATKSCRIPVLVACPASGQTAGRARLGPLPSNVIFVDPSEMLAKVKEILATLPG